MNNKAIKFMLFVWASATVHCDYNKMPLPSPQTKAISFGANDTSYVELQPIWDQSILGVSLNAPSDIVMGPDGVIFLADEGNDQILAISKAGDILRDRGFAMIAKIPHPTGLTVDSKLNLFIVNGENRIYCWNQYLNYVTIDSIAESGVYYDPVRRDTVHLNFGQLIEWRQKHNSIPQLQYFLFEKNDEKAKTAQTSYLFYEHDDPTSTFNGIAAGKFGSELLYATDSAMDKIIQIQLAADMAIKTADGQIRLRYVGIHLQDVVGYGSGAGTVDDPWSIITDRDENIYFTQLGGNFRVQKLAANTFVPGYVLYQHDIMDLGRFVAPYDVTLDEAGNIFVLDTGAGVVFKFGNSGASAGQLLSMGTKGLAVTTFNGARGIMAQDRIVYVVEGGASRIRRFQYSVSDADLPDDNKTP